MNFSFSNKEKLKSKKLIDQLFLEGKSVSAYPLRLVYIETEHLDGTKLKVGVSVSKRNFKKAVDRNHIKRLLREAYRLTKNDYFNNISTQFAFMILYIGKEKPSYIEVENKTKLLFKGFLNKISK